VVNLFVDSLVTPAWLRLLGVRYGTDCRFRGRPIVKLARGAQIRLGTAVSVNSRADSNPAGIPHPTILATLGPGSSITIGDRTGISGASITARQRITIGSDVLIGAGACVWDTDFHPLDPAERLVHQTAGAASWPVTICDGVFIGGRALILKGVTIGMNAVVGAGAVVTKDVRPGDVVCGNPARVVGSVHGMAERSRVDS
jgi:acetyltransferase-like isoleucine patch superfamily enzyme